MAKKEKGNVEFELIPAEKVPTTSRASSTLYKDIVDQFDESGEEAVEVHLGDKKARNISWGIYRYLKKAERTDIKSVVRNDICYLTKV